VLRRVEYLEVRQWKWTPGDPAIQRGSIDPSLSSVRARQLRDAARERGCTLLLVFEAGVEEHVLVKPDVSDWAVAQQLRGALVDVEPGKVLDLGTAGNLWRESVPSAQRHESRGRLLRQHTQPIAEALATELLDKISDAGDSEGVTIPFHAHSRPAVVAPEPSPDLPR
jgi:hypothetical protein